MSGDVLNGVGIASIGIGRLVRFFDPDASDNASLVTGHEIENTPEEGHGLAALPMLAPSRVAHVRAL